MKLLVLSIKTKYLDLIRKGIKTYEYRKSIFKSKQRFALIYSSGIEKKVSGIMFLGEIIKGTPETLWERTGKSSGLSRNEFFEYFQGRTTAYAIEIKYYTEFSTKEGHKVKLINPPQSFYYVQLESRRDLIGAKPEINAIIGKNQLSLSV